jgi:hypothetical protein
MEVAFLLCGELEQPLVEALSMASMVMQEIGQTIVKSFEVDRHAFAPRYTRFPSRDTKRA